MREEAERVLPMLLARATKPSGEEGVKHVIGRRFGLFPQPQRSEAEWAMWWRDYIDVLGHLPAGAIEAGMQRWLVDVDAEFMPKPGKLLDLAKSTPNKAVRSYERAKAAVEYQPPVVREKVDLDPILRSKDKPRGEPSTADKERVRQQMREYIRQDDERKAKAKTSVPPPPPRHGSTDETGVTPEMRELMGRVEL